MACIVDNGPVNGKDHAFHAPACAIHTLPNEVLSLIFEHCELSSDRHSPVIYMHDTIRTSDFHWILSYVCRRWRAIVLTSPLLWSDIRINVERYNKCPGFVVEAYPFLLELTIQRSRNVDLRVMLADTKVAGKRRADFIRTLIPILLPTASRWRCLDLYGFSELMDVFTACPLERLRNLNVVLWKESQDQRRLNVFKHVHGLTKLGLQSNRPIELQLGGTRSIELPRLSLNGIRNYTAPIDGLIHLPHMPQLEKLYIRWVSFDRPIQLDPLLSEMQQLSPFVLPRLHTMTIYYLPSNPLIGELSRKLRAPLLETLKLALQNYQNITHPSLSWFPDFETFDSLTKLSINSVVSLDCLVHTMLGSMDWQVAIVVAFLSRTSSVTTLFLGSNVAVPAVLEAIGRGLLPQLQTLSLFLPSIQKNATRNAVVSMLEQRAQQPGVSRITEVRFSKTDDMYMENDRGQCLCPSVESIVRQTDLRRRWAALCEIIDVRYIDRIDF